ncbi:bifunctional proline dehydrogenase/L-glutamate gamma-semialdehyde dehydrogenase [Actinomycetaceae bacterium L2_0104]
MSFDPSLIEQSIDQAKKWIEAARAYPAPRSATLLAEALRHEDGLDYTVSFVDSVIRPEDPKVASDNLKRLAKRDTSFLPAWLAAPAKLGGSLAPTAPKIAANAALKVFAALVGDLVLDVTADKLGPAIEKLREDGSRLNINLLGEAVLGDEEASRRLAATRELVERADVDYVSLKVSSVIGPHAPFGHRAAVDNAVNKLLPLFQLAAATGTFINLDMEEYKDLDLTIEVFKHLLDRDDLLHYRAGIVLQAYLPDAKDCLADLTQWSRQRRARGGAPIKVRLVKGANLSMERVDALMHGWPLTVEPTKAMTDANYMAVLSEALTSENLDAVNIGVAGMNLFSLAYSLNLLKQRGIPLDERVDVEMLAGMATPQSQAVRDTIGPLLYYVPVVRPEEYDVAVAYLVRRLEENAASENFMSNVFELDESPVFELEAERFREAARLGASDALSFTPNRRQDRHVAATIADGFENAPDTDPSLMANVHWAEEIASRMVGSRLGIETADSHTLRTAEQIDEAIARVKKAQLEWASKSGAERAAVLRAVGQGFENRRADLIEVAGSEAGKLVDQGDVEVSEATDFALYYASLAEELDRMEGATFKPVSTTLITPPWNFPMAIPAGGALAALAAGSGVLFKPAFLTRRTGAVLAEIMWEAGVPRDLLVLIDLDRSVSRELGEKLVREADQVILTGGIETAQRFKDWRPDLRLFAETSGKNAIIVTPQADIDLAVRDVVYSAFGHAGQKCSAASLVILVGSAGYSKRFQRQLVDSVKSLRLGFPQDLSAQMGPCVEEPSGKLLRGLTELDPGQHWVLKPRQISGNLWSPGIRAGVRPGSEYHLTEYFGPILGVMRAKDLEEAVALQNAVEFGLTAGLHSLDPKEIEYWLDHVQAGNVYLNRGITGAIVRRQPFGGWKRSSVGAGTKAGGPNYLYALGHVEPDFTVRLPRQVHIASEPLRRARAIAGTMSVIDQSRFLRIIRGMDAALSKEFLVNHDPTDLHVEKNVFRYRPFPNSVVRLASDQSVGDLLAVVAAAVAVGTKPVVSTALPVSKQMAEFFGEYDLKVVRESDAEFASYMASHSSNQDGVRVRMIGGDSLALAKAVRGSVDVAIFDEPVTACGRIEVLPFVLEQAVSATNHRFGNPTRLLEGIL